jgi:hypothetical protein
MQCHGYVESINIGERRETQRGRAVRRNDRMKRRKRRGTARKNPGWKVRSILGPSSAGRLLPLSTTLPDLFLKRGRHAKGFSDAAGCAGRQPTASNLGSEEVRGRMSDEQGQ